uniref:Uncharacterized protein n=1 Tax=Arundo donax TaxID=35708 RepID=A0A0A8YB23_ARUDO
MSQLHPLEHHNVILNVVLCASFLMHEKFSEARCFRYAS